MISFFPFFVFCLGPSTWRNSWKPLCYVSGFQAFWDFCFDFSWSDFPIYRQSQEVVEQAHRIEHASKTSVIGSFIQNPNGQKHDSIDCRASRFFPKVDLLYTSTDGKHSFLTHRKQVVFYYQAMEFFNSYRTGFPSGPFPPCLSWIGGAPTTLPPSPEPSAVRTCAWLFLFFV